MIIIESQLIYKVFLKRIIYSKILSELFQMYVLIISIQVNKSDLKISSGFLSKFP